MYICVEGGVRVCLSMVNLSIDTPLIYDPGSRRCYKVCVAMHVYGHSSGMVAVDYLRVGGHII